ncbi:MAG: arylsulfatase A-like enzyme [Verrucomicrobiales bacterium]|jgi:arylsulfatase A-like enzyme
MVFRTLLGWGMILYVLPIFAIALAFATSSWAKPNLLIILADDMGYGDLGCYGSKQIETPVLDKLAAGGVRCTDGYVSGNVCAPSRAGLLTGRYQQRFGFEHNLNRNFPTFPERLGIPKGQKTIADHLKSAGYRTGIVGKWHVGDSISEMLPNARGFDFFFGMHGGSHQYFPTPEKHQLMRNKLKVSKIRTPYLTDWFTLEATDFMREEHAEPWFLFLSYNTPHTPMQAKQEDLERFAHIPDQRRRAYAAMQWCMDQNVGKVLATLTETQQLQDTLVVFFSDNGGSVTASHACNAPLRGMKGSFLEGGIRVPFIWHWPAGGLSGGKVFKQPFTSLDLLPTFMAAAGAEMPERVTKKGKGKVVNWDGFDLLPYLRGEKQGPPHETLFWRMVMRGQAVREGKWKLLLNVHTPPALYDLSKDISELENLYATEPEVVARLWGKLNQWEESLEDTPHWTESTYWQGYNRKLYLHDYWLTQPGREASYRGVK